jgi:diguanylate cyclase (GGDEF)-like protein
MSEKSTVLAIDDAPANLKLLGQILSPDYRFVFATKGADGLEIAINQRPDIILTDVVMPEMDGHQVCKQLKGNPLTAKIPVIFITSLKDETDEAFGLEIGAIDYITKPFSPAIVKARVRNHLELKHYRDMLESQAATDGLTGIPNRRQFDETLEREWRSAIRRKTCISLVLMDIDCFKAYNDFYGHLQGDECLRSVGRSLIGGARRPSELIARYGGEEFACVLPDTDLTGAVHVATELLDRVRGLELAHEKSIVANHVTLSLGVACMNPEIGENPSELIQRADAQLYEAKRGGRNQVRGQNQ